jgi:hypothetical protein
MFQVNKYYTHRKFQDVYFKVLTDFGNDSYYIGWYNKNFKHHPNFIDWDTVTIKNKEGFSEYVK